MTLAIVQKIYPDRTADITVGGRTIPRVSGYPSASVGETVNYINGTIQQNPGATKKIAYSSASEPRQIRFNDSKPRNKLFYPYVDEINPIEYFSAFFAKIRTNTYTQGAYYSIGSPVYGGDPCQLGAGQGIINTYAYSHPSATDPLLWFTSTAPNHYDITSLDAGFSSDYAYTTGTKPTGFYQHSGNSSRSDPSSVNAMSDAQMAAFTARNIARNAAESPAFVSQTGTAPHPARVLASLFADIAALIPTLNIGDAVPIDYLAYCHMQEIFIPSDLWKVTPALGDDICLIVDNPGYFVAIGDGPYRYGVANYTLQRIDGIRVKFAYFDMAAPYYTGFDAPESTTPVYEPFFSSGMTPYFVKGTGPTAVITSEGSFCLHAGTVVFPTLVDYLAADIYAVAGAVIYRSTPTNGADKEYPGIFARDSTSLMSYFHSKFLPPTDTREEFIVDPAAGDSLRTAQEFVVNGVTSAPIDNGLPMVVRDTIDYSDFNSLKDLCHVIEFPFFYYRYYAPEKMFYSTDLPSIQAFEYIRLRLESIRAVYGLAFPTPDIPVYAAIPASAAPIRIDATPDYASGYSSAPYVLDYAFSGLTHLGVYTDTQPKIVNGLFDTFYNGDFSETATLTSITFSGGSFTATYHWNVQGTLISDVRHGLPYDGAATVNHKLELYVLKCRIYIPPNRTHPTTDSLIQGYPGYETILTMISNAFRISLGNEVRGDAPDGGASGVVLTDYVPYYPVGTPYIQSIYAQTYWTFLPGDRYYLRQ